jgi:hypothetical protein
MASSDKHIKRVKLLLVTGAPPGSAHIFHVKSHMPVSYVTAVPLYVECSCNPRESVRFCYYK